MPAKAKNCSGMGKNERKQSYNNQTNEQPPLKKPHQNKTKQKNPKPNHKQKSKPTHKNPSEKHSSLKEILGEEVKDSCLGYPWKNWF